MNLTVKTQGSYDGDVVVPHDVTISIPTTPPVLVKLSKERIVAQQDLDVADDVVALLQTGRSDLRTFKPQDQEALQSLTRHIRIALRTVLTHAKFGLRWTGLSERLFAFKHGDGDSWSLDGQTWKPIPHAIDVEISMRAYGPLNTQNAKDIEERIRRGHAPFIAYRHLHRAIVEDSPRYKWIDATIAAELGIKEFLIRLKPDVQEVILELPSPPLHKLYGGILKSWVGEASPRVSELAKGAERRNRLLHRPEQETIARKEAEEYVDHVEEALEHLTRLLRRKEA